MTTSVRHTLTALDFLNDADAVPKAEREALVSQVKTACDDDGVARSESDIAWAVDGAIHSLSGAVMPRAELLMDVPTTREGMVALVNAPFKPPAKLDASLRPDTKA